MSVTAQEEFAAFTARNQSKSTSHPEDHHTSDHSEPNSDSESTRVHSSDDDSDSASPRTSNNSRMPTAVYTIPNTVAFESNTGPKGVIADAQSFERARKRSFRQTLQAFSNGLGFGEKSKSRSPSPGTSPEISGDDDEDEFMRTWRANRMTEMQNQGRDPKTRRLSPSKRRYGKVASVGPIGYLDAIEKVTADTVVVVLINDDQSTVSSIVEDALATLARKHEFTRFIKMSYEDAEMDPVTVPAILAYKAGDLIANLVSVIDEIPAGRHMSSSSLESLLKDRQVLF